MWTTWTSLAFIISYCADKALLTCVQCLPNVKVLLVRPQDTHNSQVLKLMWDRLTDDIRSRSSGAIRIWESNPNNQWKVLSIAHHSKPQTPITYNRWTTVLMSIFHLTHSGLTPMMKCNLYIHRHHFHQQKMLHLNWLSQNCPRILATKFQLHLYSRRIC